MNNNSSSSSSDNDPLLDGYSVSFLSIMAVFAFIAFLSCCIGTRPQLESDDDAAANNAPPPQRDATPAANNAPVVIQRVHVVIQSDAPNNAPSAPVSIFPFYKAAVTAARSGCAVCQGDFKDGEEAKQLPGCGHVFHRTCIDPWLIIHPTCPICRNSAPPPPNQ